MPRRTGKCTCYQAGEKTQAVPFTFQAKASVLDDHEQGGQHHSVSLSKDVISTQASPTFALLTDYC